MERRAVEKAKEVHRRHPELSFPVDMDWLANAEGCHIVSWPFLGPVKEMKRGSFIGLAQGLESRERRYLSAHGLAHHLLHCGNQLFFLDWDRAITWKQEREADDCAAHILIPEEELLKLGTAPVWELADYFGVPDRLAMLRITEFATRRELARRRCCSMALYESI